MTNNENTIARSVAGALAADLRGTADDGRELTVVELVQSCESQGVSAVDKLAEALDQATKDRQ